MQGITLFFTFCLAAVGGASTVVYFDRPSPAAAPGPIGDEAAPTPPAAVLAVGALTQDENAATNAGPPVARAAPVEPAPPSATVAGSPAAQAFDAAPVLPSAPSPRPSKKQVAGQPLVAAQLAFTALQSVGKDPAAEAIWKRAINDPALSSGDRSDLIEDLNDEGYENLSNLTLGDIELILARLKLIEEQAPLAMDEVNATAFTEAYKDLLAMLARARQTPAPTKVPR